LSDLHLSPSGFDAMATFGYCDVVFDVRSTSLVERARWINHPIG
jgi:hypothetical protein